MQKSSPSPHSPVVSWLWAGLLLAFLFCPACARVAVSRDEKTSISHSAVSSWERIIDGLYENRGIARIEKLGSRYVLTMYCYGQHSVYIKNTKEIDLNRLLDRFVRVRYTYVEEINPDVKCPQAPCGPFFERLLVIANVVEVDTGKDDLEHFKASCTPN